MQRFFLWFFFIASAQSAQALATNVQDTINHIKNMHNLALLSFDFDEQQVLAQSEEHSSAVDFFAAASFAMASFIDDNSDEESPLQLSYEDVGEASANKNLHNIMNQQTSKFGVVTTKNDSDFIPARGETLQQSWIFYLKLDGFDHVFWAIVDRAGLKETYNYGFN